MQGTLKATAKMQGFSSSSQSDDHSQSHSDLTNDTHQGKEKSSERHKVGEDGRLWTITASVAPGECAPASEPADVEKPMQPPVKAAARLAAAQAVHGSSAQPHMRTRPKGNQSSVSPGGNQAKRRTLNSSAVPAVKKPPGVVEDALSKLQEYIQSCGTSCV